MRLNHFKLSVITPFYNEAQGEVIKTYFDKLVPILEKITQDYEIVCVDDGSKDNQC